MNIEVADEKRKERLTFLLGLVLPIGILIAFLHGYAIKEHLYWVYWWMDILMHYLGGIWVASLLLWFVYGMPILKKKNSDTYFIFWFLLIVVLVIGVMWEVFEYITGVFLAEEFFPDTLHDIVLDVAGMVTVFFLYIGLKRNEQN